MQIGEGDECLTEKWVNILGIVAILVGTVIAILVKSYSTLHAWITKMFLITLIKLDKLYSEFYKIYFTGWNVDRQNQGLHESNYFCFANNR